MYRKNTAGQYVFFWLVSATDGSAAGGKTVTVRRCIDGTFAAGGGTVTEDNLGSPDVTTGRYCYAMSQADTNGNDIGLFFSATGVIPVSFTFPTTAADPTDGVRFGLTGLANAVPGAAGGLFIAGTNAATTITTSLTTTFTGNLTGSVASVTGLTASDVGAIKTQTDKLTFTVANQIDANVIDWKGAAAPAMTGDAFARLGAPAGASVSADIAAVKAVDDAIKTKTDFLPSATAGAAGGLFIAGTNAPVTITGSGDALTLTSTGGNGCGLNATANGSGDGVRATGGLSGDGIQGFGGTNGNGFHVKGNGTGGGILAEGGSGASNGIQATSGAGGSDIVGNIVGNITGNLSGSVGSVTGLNAALIDVATSTRLAAADYTAPANATIAAIDAKTTNLPTDPADESLIIAATDAIMTRIGIAGAGLTALGDARLANLDAAVSTRAATGAAMTLTTGERDATATALLDLANGVETGMTLRQAQRVGLAALAGKLSGAATATVTVRDTNDLKNRLVVSADADGNRSAVTIDAT